MRTLTLKRGEERRLRAGHLWIFSNEIDGWIIDRLEAIGLDTAKSVLALSPADIAKRADLEDETVEEIFDILRSEFEE